jgi:hypothetical protein
MSSPWIQSRPLSLVPTSTRTSVQLRPGSPLQRRASAPMTS